MRYEARFLIGRGAMAEIWVGLQRGPRGFERPVVLKRAHSPGPSAEGTDPDEPLVREAELLGLIAHPNVVSVIDLAKTPRGLVLVLELVRGVSLRSWLSTLARDGRMHSIGSAARLIADAARGLEAAQGASDVQGRAANIVHRDVSPENLMVAEHGLVKLLDFGVARTTLRDRTVVPVIKGKLPYLSPEQVEGRDVDGRSDVFALGALLYEVVTTRRLFAADQATAVLDAIARARTSDLPDHVPPELRSLFLRMTAREPRARPSLSEIASVLEDIAVTERVGHARIADDLEKDMSRALDALRAKLAGLSAADAVEADLAPTDVDVSLAFGLDAWAATGEPTEMDATVTTKEHVR